MAKEILAFSLVVLMDGDVYEKHADYFLHLEECRYNAQELSRDQKFYKPIKAYCSPAFVDPKENTIKGHVINKPVVKPAEVKK